MPPPQALQFSPKAGEAGELEAGETGDEHPRDRILSPSLPPLRAHHFRSERDVWERGREKSGTQYVAMVTRLLDF